MEDLQESPSMDVFSLYTSHKSIHRLKSIHFWVNCQRLISGSTKRHRPPWLFRDDRSRRL